MITYMCTELTQRLDFRTSILESMDATHSIHVIPLNLIRSRIIVLQVFQLTIKTSFLCTAVLCQD